MPIIEIISYECRGIWNHLHIDCIVNGLLYLTSTKYLYVPPHCPFVWEIHRCPMDSKHNDTKKKKASPWQHHINLQNKFACQHNARVSFSIRMGQYVQQNSEKNKHKSFPKQAWNYSVVYKSQNK